MYSNGTESFLLAGGEAAEWPWQVSDLWWLGGVEPLPAAPGTGLAGVQGFSESRGFGFTGFKG